jgi:EAL domain-containing protein (putative c-di-GMP-specific phosphodiesterase class I)
MRAADIAMYHAKASGRSRVCLYDNVLGEASEEKARTAAALRQALQRDEFETAFQPQFCTRTGAVLAAEALIRWNHPSGRVRTPDSFISVAEASGLILDIGDWAVEAAAQALGRWRVAGQAQRIVLNLSPRQLERRDFLPALRRALTRSASPPWPLELEFSESIAHQCSDALIAELAALREQGVTIAIDDFGGGASNLGRIRHMPVDRMKLDKALVAEIDKDETALNIVSAVIHLVHGLGCQAVAAGVERQEQVDVLRAVGCDAIQGFAFEPMSEGAFLRWLREQEDKAAAPRAAQPSAASRMRA